MDINITLIGSIDFQVFVVINRLLCLNENCTRYFRGRKEEAYAIRTDICVRHLTIKLIIK